jgi:ribulose-5-phosphate 4-epimerase/fuculose-1-phosphate aldolase
MKGGLLPLVQQSMYFHGHLSYHDWDVQTSGQDECDALAADLGPKNMAMILRNHGLLACGRTPGQAFVNLYNLEIGCKVQVDVMMAGQDIVLPGEEELARTAIYGDPDRDYSAEREWDAIIRWLERTDTSYRT